MSLEKLRSEIDRLDKRLVELLNRRAGTALRIGQFKKQRHSAVYVPAREKKVLDNVRKINSGPLSDTAIAAVYREIMSASLALEQPLRVAYLGPPATFTHQAARARFGASVQYLACETISDVFRAVENRQADYGVAPIENSFEGTVTHTLDEFASSSLSIYAEIYLPIAHYMLARCTKRSSICRIYSKDQVFGQCRTWLRNNCQGIELAPVSSTARAAEMAAREKNTAALAGLLAAEMYGLKVLARNIHDSSANTTRFLVLGNTPSDSPSGNDKTSLLFSIKHCVGALHEVLGVFRKNGINMTRIESRPNRQKAWEYMFFVDIEGHAKEPRVNRALNMLEKHCTACKALGSYPRAPESDLLVDNTRKKTVECRKTK